MHDNYQHVATKLSHSLSELKAELDSHGWTKDQLKAAADELIFDIVNVVNAVKKLEDENNQLLWMTAELIASQSDIGILEGMYRRCDVQKSINKQSKLDRSLLQKLNEWKIGQQKWKNISCQLFRVQILRPYLIKLSVDHIRNHTYPSKSIARAMGMHDGFNLCCSDAMWLLWSSFSIK
jgi:hypothetical protein